jgi:hypothetical protein
MDDTRRKKCHAHTEEMPRPHGRNATPTRNKDNKDKESWKTLKAAANEAQSPQKLRGGEKGGERCEEVWKKLYFQAGLPDFSWYAILKRDEYTKWQQTIQRDKGKLYQMETKYLKWPQNITKHTQIGIFGMKICRMLPRYVHTIFLRYINGTSWSYIRHFLCIQTVCVDIIPFFDVHRKLAKWK